MHWSKRVVEVKDRERLVQLIESGDKLISGVAALTGLPGRHDCLMGLVDAQKAYREQLAERDSAHNT